MLACTPVYSIVKGSVEGTKCYIMKLLFVLIFDCNLVYKRLNCIGSICPRHFNFKQFREYQRTITIILLQIGSGIEYPLFLEQQICGLISIGKQAKGSLEFYPFYI